MIYQTRGSKEPVSLSQGYKLSIYYLTVNYIVYSVGSIRVVVSQKILKSFSLMDPFKHFPALVAIPKFLIEDETYFIGGYLKFQNCINFFTGQLKKNISAKPPCQPFSYFSEYFYIFSESPQA